MSRDRFGVSRGSTRNPPRSSRRAGREACHRAKKRRAFPRGVAQRHRIEYCYARARSRRSRSIVCSYAMRPSLKRLSVASWTPLSGENIHETRACLRARRRSLFSATLRSPRAARSAPTTSVQRALPTARQSCRDQRRQRRKLGRRAQRRPGGTRRTSISRRRRSLGAGR